MYRERYTRPGSMEWRASVGARYQPEAVINKQTKRAAKINGVSNHESSVIAKLSKTQRHC